MKRRILIGSLSYPNFAILTAHELIFFKSLQKLNSFLVSRNLFTYLSVWRAVQLNVHKRNVNKCRNKCIPFTHVFYREWIVEMYQLSSRLKRVIQINALLK